MQVPDSDVSRQQTEQTWPPPPETDFLGEIVPLDRDGLRKYHFRAAFDGKRPPALRAWHARQAKILQGTLERRHVTPWTWQAALAGAKGHGKIVRCHHPRRKSKSFIGHPGASDFPWDDWLEVILAAIALRDAAGKAPAGASGPPGPPLT
jgi:hypothetical protein